MSSSDRVKLSLGDSGEEGGHIQGSVTLLSRLGVIKKRLVLKNGHLGCLLCGIHRLSLNIHGFVDTSIT